MLNFYSIYLPSDVTGILVYSNPKLIPGLAESSGYNFHFSTIFQLSQMTIEFGTAINQVYCLEAVRPILLT